jgi:hypothetical protein
MGVRGGVVEKHGCPLVRHVQGCWVRVDVQLAFLDCYFSVRG